MRARCEVYNSWMTQPRGTLTIKPTGMARTHKTFAMDRLHASDHELPDGMAQIPAVDFDCDTVRFAGGSHSGTQLDPG